MRFKIGSRPTIYSGEALTGLTLMQAVQLEQETAALGRTLTLGELQAMAEEIDALPTDADRMRHPAGIWVLAVMVWAARIRAGETLSLADAINFPLTELQLLPEPQDHKAAKAAPRKARPSKAASGRAGSPAVAIGTTPAQPASGGQSTSG